MKKILILLFTLLCIGCSKNEENLDKKQHGCSIEETCGIDVEETADMNEYGLDEGNVFISITYGQAIELIKNEATAVIYIGRPSCPWCMDAVPVLNEVAKEYQSTVYYIFTRSDDNQSEKQQANKDLLMEYMQDYLNENDEGEKALFIPNVLFIKEGRIVGNHIDTVDGYDANERDMNEDEIEQLKTIYRNYFEKVK